MSSNLDKKTVASFGKEWERFDQSNASFEEMEEIFSRYFSVFPWERISRKAVGFDMGCGTGRWARFVAPRVGTLHCVDPSSALEVAKKNLQDFTNISFHAGSVDDEVLPKESQDFGYSLGVLHHVPDTEAAIKSCVALLKPGAPLLLYIYYAFENRPWWFKLIWRISDIFRRIITHLPERIKYSITDIIALLIYWPLSRVAYVLDKLGLSLESFPLFFYKNKSFYTLRTDARDRFGTPLEQRFKREEIERIMIDSGLDKIVFSESSPFWCVVGVKR